ncbi:K(+)-transporting ATPase subunit F [Granulicella sp. dw_53]|uniref:K(+)-transporting ATPase subunit F n=1 Tax=Granulicella sp. dw_53 TaxID=2719792 RepID=UPI001BD43560
MTEDFTFDVPDRGKLAGSNYKTSNQTPSPKSESLPLHACTPSLLFDASIAYRASVSRPLPRAASNRTSSTQKGRLHVGHRMHRSNGNLLHSRYRIHRRLRSPRKQRGPLMIETILLSLVTLSLLGYLVFALLRPEKF